MHSKRLDLSNYIKDLTNRVSQEPNELIRYQIQEYIDFISKLISIANIMDKKFFIVIPYQLTPAEAPKEGLLSGLFGNPHAHLKVPLKRFQLIKEELTQRTNVISSGLSSMGITSEILTTKQLIELYYRTYNQEEALNEKLQGDVEAFGVEQQPSATDQAQTNINPPSNANPQESGQVPPPSGQTVNVKVNSPTEGKPNA